MRQDWGPLKGQMSAQKALQSVKDQDEGVVGTSEREQYLPRDKVSLLCPPGKINYIDKKQTEGKWVLVARHLETLWKSGVLFKAPRSLNELLVGVFLGEGPRAEKFYHVVATQDLLF